MNQKNKTILSWLYYAMILLMVYAIGYQFKKNLGLREKKLEIIEEAMETPDPHPMTSVNESLYLPYAAAWHRVMDSSDKDFWLVCWDLDPAFILNYSVYPEKRLFMNVKTQEDLNKKNLMQSKEPIHPTPPETHCDKVVVTNETSAEIKDTWPWQP